MTDCELLVLSAKAAGYVLTKESTSYREFLCRDGVEWNPLTRDGDALRLMVDLRLEVEFTESTVLVGFETLPSAIQLELLVKDTHAATCRAITRAAAEIGRSME